MSWIQTFTGRRFDLLHPRQDDVDIIDIAHALSHVCRFAGHTDRFYSVAQHCVIVSQLCQPWEALYGLLHDAAEAYIGDITRPLKIVLGDEIKAREYVIEKVIFERFGIDWDGSHHQAIKVWDEMALVTEARDLFTHAPIGDWSKRYGAPMVEKIKPVWPGRAELLFLCRFVELHREAHLKYPGIAERINKLTLPSTEAAEMTETQRANRAHAAYENAQPAADGEETQVAPVLKEPLSELGRSLESDARNPLTTRRDLVACKTAVMNHYARKNLRNDEAVHLHEILNDRLAQAT